DIGGKRQRETTAACGPVHERYDGLRTGAHQLDDVEQVIAGPRASRAIRRAVAARRGVFLDVETGAERAPRAAHHDDAHVVVLLERAKVIAQLLRHRAGYGVQTL